MLFFYVRHGDPTYNPDALTPLGRRQAEAVGRRLSAFGVDKIYASTSTRAIQTAQPAAEMMKKEITQLDFANESHAWNELSVIREDGLRTWAMSYAPYRKLFLSDEIRRLGREWYRHPALAEFPMEQGMRRIQRETDAFFESLGYRHTPGLNAFQAVHHHEERVALFAHQGFGLAFLSCVLDIPYPEMCIHFDMGHSGLTVIEFRKETEDSDLVIPRVLTLGNDGHLWRDGMPTAYQNQIRF